MTRALFLVIGLFLLFAPRAAMAEECGLLVDGTPGLPVLMMP